MAVMVFSLAITSFAGIGMAQTSAVPYSDTGIGEDTDTIEYEVVASSDFANVTGNNTSVDVNIVVTGINETSEGDVTTQLLTKTNTLSEGENVTNTYNVTDTDRSTYDRYSIEITMVDSTLSDYITDTNVVISSVGSGGGIVAEDSPLSFLNGSIAGIPTIAIVLLLLVGLFVQYNDKDEFDE